MIGYGLAKAAVHQLTKSLAEEKSGLPKESLVVSILPITLDTPMNRKWMPQADHSSWTPLEFIAEYVITNHEKIEFILILCLFHFICRTFAKWTIGNERPANGSLVRLVTKNNTTDLILAE